MAQRFGGKYSPGGTADTPAPQARVHPVGARVNFLFVLPFMFAARAFFQDPAGLALNLAAFAVLMLAAWLTREGVLAQAAYDARAVARRPALPRKMVASGLTGIGLGLAGLVAGPATAAAGIVLGAALHFGAFGPDPLSDKGMDKVDAFQTDRVARAVEGAEAHLKDMRDAIRRTNERAMVERVDTFASSMRALFRAVQDDPRQLSAAQRYLGVYLLGARDASVKFADLYTRKRDSDARAAYLALLDDLQARIDQRRDTLLGSDRQALDIEMEVLRERLEREGLRPETETG